MKHAKHTKHATHARGFTLVELMVVVGIVAILAAVAIPQYSNYVTRSKFAEAHSQLGSLRVNNEQWFMDNRTYVGAGGGTTCGATMPTLKYFTYTCTATASTYTITATGITAQGLRGIQFTINESNTKATVVTAGQPMAVAGYASDPTCWLVKIGSC